MQTMQPGVSSQHIKSTVKIQGNYYNDDNSSKIIPEVTPRCNDLCAHVAKIIAIFLIIMCDVLLLYKCILFADCFCANWVSMFLMCYHLWWIQMYKIYVLLLYLAAFLGHFILTDVLRFLSCLFMWILSIFSFLTFIVHEDPSAVGCLLLNVTNIRYT